MIYECLSLDDKRRNPSDMTHVIDNKERIVSYEVISKVSSNIIEEEDVWCPNTAWSKLQPG